MPKIRRDNLETSSLPKTQKEAKQTQSKYYYTGCPCRRGHLAVRRAGNFSCLECEWEDYEIDKEERKNRARQWVLNNPEQRKEYLQNYREKNRPRLSAKSKEWAVNNPDKRRKIARDWVKNNPEYSASNAAYYRATKLKATPAWVNRYELECVYFTCKEKTKETARAHHVDHIIPLQNESVCGLHVPWNLQILLAEDNIRKGNSFDVDAGDFEIQEIESTI